VCNLSEFVTYGNMSRVVSTCSCVLRSCIHVYWLIIHRIVLSCLCYPGFIDVFRQTTRRMTDDSRKTIFEIHPTMTASEFPRFTTASRSLFAWRLSNCETWRHFVIIIRSQTSQITHRQVVQRVGLLRFPIMLKYAHISLILSFC